MIVVFVAPNEVEVPLEKKPLVAKRLVEVAFVAVKLVNTAVIAEISVAKNEDEVAFPSEAFTLEKLVVVALVTVALVALKLVVVAFVVVLLVEISLVIVPEATAKSVKEVSVVLQNKKSLPVAYVYPQNLFNPPNKGDINISFKKPTKEVKKVMDYFKVINRHDAGSLSFDYFYKNQIGKK